MVRESVSDINLIYVLMIQTTILLGLTSYALSMTFYLPRVVQHCIETFDLLNAQSKGQRSLLEACSDEIYQIQDATRSKQSALSLLENYLKYLVGRHSSNINILKRSLMGANEYVTRYCIALIIVIAANLYIAQPGSPNREVHECLGALLTYLKSVVDNSKYHFLAIVHRKLETTKSVNELFGILEYALPMKRAVKVDNIYTLCFTNGYLHFEKLQGKRKEVIPDISIKEISVDKFLLQRLSTTFNEQLLDPGTEEEETESVQESAQDLNIDLKVEQKDWFTILTCNKIENNFCNVCGKEIDNVLQVQSNATIERQTSLSTEEAQDKHMKEDNHNESLRSYREYDEVRLESEILLPAVLQEIEKAKSSDNIDVVERSVSCEEQIKKLEDDDMESYNWSERKQILQRNIKVLKECLKDLQNFQSEAVDHDV